MITYADGLEQEDKLHVLAEENELNTLGGGEFDRDMQLIAVNSNAITFTRPALSVMFPVTSL